MRRWTRARFDTLCGGPCGKTIHKGQPLLEIAVAGMSMNRRFRRCQDCAGEPVPSDLPVLEAMPVNELRPMMPVRFSAEMLPIDFKVRQAGEGE